MHEVSCIADRNVANTRPAAAPSCYRLRAGNNGRDTDQHWFEATMFNSEKTVTQAYCLRP